MRRIKPASEPMQGVASARSWQWTVLRVDDGVERERMNEEVTKELQEL